MSSFLTTLKDLPTPFVGSKRAQPLPVTSGTVVRNGLRTLAESVHSIVDVVDEVMIVDHGSTDGTPAMIAELATLYDNITYLDGSSLSFANARNLIIDRARNPWILKWDADHIAVRREYGFDRDIMEILKQVLSDPTIEYATIRKLFISTHIDYGLLDPSYGGSDGRFYKRNAGRYMTLHYADQFVFKSGLRKLAVHGSEHPFYIISLKKFKSPEGLVHRKKIFKYDILKAHGQTDIKTFDEWFAKRVDSKRLKKKITNVLSEVQGNLRPLLDEEKLGPSWVRESLLKKSYLPEDYLESSSRTLAAAFRNLTARMRSSL